MVKRKSRKVKKEERGFVNNMLNRKWQDLLPDTKWYLTTKYPKIFERRKKK